MLKKRIINRFTVHCMLFILFVSCHHYSICEEIIPKWKSTINSLHNAYAFPDQNNLQSSWAFNGDIHDFFYIIYAQWCVDFMYRIPQLMEYIKNAYKTMEKKWLHPSNTGVSKLWKIWRAILLYKRTQRKYLRKKKRFVKS